jgi:energy-converting hydrogenase Eha subunit F
VVRVAAVVVVALLVVRNRLRQLEQAPQIKALLVVLVQTRAVVVVVRQQQDQPYPRQVPKMVLTVAPVFLLP